MKRMKLALQIAPRWNRTPVLYGDLCCYSLRRLDHAKIAGQRVRSTRIEIAARLGSTNIGDAGSMAQSLPRSSTPSIARHFEKQNWRLTVQEAGWWRLIELLARALRLWSTAAETRAGT